LPAVRLSRTRPETAIAVGVSLVVVAVALSYPDALADAIRTAFEHLGVAGVVALVVGVGCAGALLALAAPRRAAEPTLRRLRADGTAQAAVALPLIVAFSAGLRIALAHAAAFPRVFGDELIYSSLAKSFALGGDLLLRGDRELGYGVVYPVFASPAYALAPDGAAAFVAIKDLNAVVMSLAAVPAYFLARRVVSHGWSLAVAALSVAVPAMNYTALVMTEPVFYPGFVCLALALVLALERPTARRQLVVVALVLGLGAVRAQAFAFAPAVATAVALHAGRGRELYRFLPTWLSFAAGGLLALVAWLAAGLSPLGAYGVLARDYSAFDVVKWAAWNLADLELAVGVVALAVLPVAASRLLRRDAAAREHAFGSAAVSLTLWTLASVALLSASPYGLGRLHERNLFYVVPLLLTCLAYWLSNGLPRPRAPTAIALAGVLALPIVLPSRFVLATYSIDAPTMLALRQLHLSVSTSPKTLLILGGAVGAAVFVGARRPAIPLLTVVVAFVGVAAATDWRSPLTPTQADRLAWVDRALPAGARATLVHVDLPKDVCATVRDDGQQRRLEVWTEFFNTRIDHVASVFGQIKEDGLQSRELTIGRDGSLRAGGRELEPDYVVVDSRIEVAGTPVTVFDGRTLGGSGYEGLTLWRTGGPVRIAHPERLHGEALRTLTCTSPVS
jgi:hypothetical protein